ncbi:MAG: cupin domain-containing protein [Bacteroidales bacterium]
MMRRGTSLSAIFVVVFATALFAQQPVATSGANPKDHLIITPEEASFGPAPDAFPPGAQLAVLDGDPMGKSGNYTVRLKVPDGYVIPPHYHPADELVTVVDGSFAVGMGEQFSDSALKTLGVGGFAKMPQGMRHFAKANGATVVQVSGPAPFAITYVNPSDDPRNKK